MNALTFSSATQAQPLFSFELASALWARRKWLAVMVFSFFVSATTSVTLHLPNLYRAETTILVEQELSETTGNMTGVGDLELRLQAVNQEVLARQRMQQLITDFDLYPKLRQRMPGEIIIDRMRRDLRFERKQAEQHWGRNTTIAFTLSYQGWNQQTVAKVTNRLASYYVEQNEKIRRREVAATQAATINNGTIDLLTKKEQELVELRTHFSEVYPDVVRLKAEIAALEKFRLQDDSAVATNNEDMHDNNRQRQAAPSYEATRAGTQFTVLDYAVTPSMPSAPNRVLLLLMGLIMAIGLAAIAVLLAEQLDVSFHRIDELRSFTHVPVLASIPRIATLHDKLNRNMKYFLVLLLTLIALTIVIRFCSALGENGEPLVWMLASRGT